MVVAERGGSRLVAIEGGLASALLTVPQPYAPIGVPARYRGGGRGGGYGGDGERVGGARGGREGLGAESLLEIP